MDRGENTERSRDHQKGVSAPPLQREHQRHTKHEREWTPNQLLAKTHFENR